MAGAPAGLLHSGSVPCSTVYFGCVIGWGMNSSIDQNYEVILEKGVNGTACSCQYSTVLNKSLSSVQHPADRRDPRGAGIDAFITLFFRKVFFICRKGNKMKHGSTITDLVILD